MATISINFVSVCPKELYHAVCSLVIRYPECTINIEGQSLCIQSDLLDTAVLNYTQANLTYTVPNIHDLNPLLDKLLFVQGSTSTTPSYLLFD